MKPKPLWIWALYAAASLSILAPLLLPGYILTLDMVWTPRSFGGAAGQKLILLAIFTLAGAGAHTFIELTAVADATSRTPAMRFARWVPYLAGLIYMVNPFTYTRLLAGQYLVLAGYAMLPWFARAVWRVLQQPTWRGAAAVTGWATGIGLVSLHSLGPALIIGVAFVIAAGWGRWGSLRRPRSRARSVALRLVVAAGGWLVLNAFWLVPLLLGHSRQAQLIAGVGADQLTAYATAAGSVGAPLNVLSLQGFWADPYGRYVLPAVTGPLFWSVTVLVGALVGLGVWSAIRSRHRLMLAVAAAGTLGWVLAMGESWVGITWLNHALTAHLPFYRGYREPHKWAMLLALAYAVLAAGGVRALLTVHLRPAWRSLLPAALLIPALWVPMMLWGGAGQLRTVPYPAGWTQLNARLNALPPGRIAVFPWHQYLVLDFAGRTVANPAPRYFDRDVISSDDPELIGVAHTSPHPEVRAVQAVVDQRYGITDAGSQLAAAGIRYVVLLKQADWRQYYWLDHQAGLTVRADAPDYRLYQVY